MGYSIEKNKVSDKNLLSWKTLLPLTTILFIHDQCVGSVMIYSAENDTKHTNF